MRETLTPDMSRGAGDDGERRGVSSTPDVCACGAGRVPRRKGVRPVESIHDLAQPEAFESDEELDAFLAHVRAERDANLA